MIICKLLAILIFISSGANCGLLTGDLKMKSKPLTINSHHAPINININTNKLKPSLPALSLPKPAKPPPKSISDILKPSLLSKPDLPSLFSLKSPKIPKLPSLSKSIFKSKSKSLLPTKSLLSSKSIFPRIPSPKLTRSSVFEKSAFSPSSKLSDLLPSPKLSPLSKLSVPIIPPVLPPVIPKLPLPFSLIPPLPLIPTLPLLPIIPPIMPGVPFIPPLINPFNPLKVPILGAKSPLQKALGSELKPVIADIADEARNVILERKLRNLLKRGSLTTLEFNRFRRILLG